MVKLIVAAIILIVIMLVFVFILFKNIINRIDENAKKYFVNKMQDYDYILEEKQMRLEELKNEMENLNKSNKNIIKKEDDESFDILSEEDTEENKILKEGTVKYDLNVPEYRESNFFNNYKEVKKVFTVNNEQIIRDFIAKHKNEKEEKEYKQLNKIREKFNNDAVYNCLTLDVEDQIDVMNETLTKTEKKLVKFDIMVQESDFNVKNLVEYIDNRLEEIDPTVYVYVNGIGYNYDFIDKNIITEQYSNMSEGIIIKYKNKVYDYSI